MKLSLILGVLALVLATGVWANWPSSPLPETATADRIVVLKGARRLELYDGDHLLRVYRIALGDEPSGAKQQEGDRRTPEGNYVIDYRKPDSSYHRALHVSYPRPDQVAAARAVGVDPGGLIMIHGLPNGAGLVGRLHRFSDWTVGCIAVTNPEVEEIWRVVADGTPIEIRP